MDGNKREKVEGGERKREGGGKSGVMECGAEDKKIRKKGLTWAEEKELGEYCQLVSGKEGKGGEGRGNQVHVGGGGWSTAGIKEKRGEGGGV